MKYLIYVLEHKKNVFIECKDAGIWWHGITHDLSKLSINEFIPYAKNFYGEKDCKNCEYYMNCNFNQIGLGLGPWAKECPSYECRGFKKAWKHHYENNKHHWNYWIGKDIPYKYILQMICDWKGMGRKFGDTAQEFYLNNYKKIDVTDRTRLEIEFILGLNTSSIHNYGHTLKQFANMYDEDRYNCYFDWIKEEYGIDSYKILKD